jgi:hypothetical protein
MKKLLLLTTVAALLIAPCAFAQLGATTQTSTVSVTVAAEAALTVPTNATLTSTGTNFADYTGTTTFNYFVRTTQIGGTGSVTLQVTSDFSPANGPSVGTPPTAGDTLKYTPTVSAPGSAAAQQTSSTGAATSVGTFGADAHSAKAGNSGSVGWVLTNDPVYKTGSYTATVTWTISAT